MLMLVISWPQNRPKPGHRVMPFPNMSWRSCHQVTGSFTEGPAAPQACLCLSRPSKFQGFVRSFFGPFQADLGTNTTYSHGCFHCAILESTPCSGLKKSTNLGIRFTHWFRHPAAVIHNSKISMDFRHIRPSKTFPFPAFNLSADITQRTGQAPAGCCSW